MNRVIASVAAIAVAGLGIDYSEIEGNLYSRAGVAAIMPDADVDPSPGKCATCNGTGRVGDGRTFVTCQECGGDGIVSADVFIDRVLGCDGDGCDSLRDRAGDCVCGSIGGDAGDASLVGRQVGAVQEIQEFQQDESSHQFVDFQDDVQVCADGSCDVAASSDACGRGVGPVRRIVARVINRDRPVMDRIAQRRVIGAPVRVLRRILGR